MSNIEIFKNEEFGEIRTLEINNEPWFVGKDVAIILGYKKPRNAISNHCKCVVKLKVPTSGGNQQMSLIPEDDIYRLIQNSKNKPCEYKERLMNWLIYDNLIESKAMITSRKEIEFINMLSDFLVPFGIVGECQYNVLNYRIDYYIKSLSIAIEYDENNHNNYTYDEHEGRQKEIEEELGCKFIRVSDYYSNEYNIGLIIKNIFNINNVA